MKLSYKITEQAGTFGGRSFVANVSVELSEAESAVRSQYGVYERIELGEKFKDVKGVDALGDISLRDLLEKPKDYKLASIQQASDFISRLKTGLKRVKDQIDGTATSIGNLNRIFEMEIE